jgi:hypothetical protein
MIMLDVASGVVTVEHRASAPLASPALALF